MTRQHEIMAYIEKKKKKKRKVRTTHINHIKNDFDQKKKNHLKHDYFFY